MVRRNKVQSPLAINFRLAGHISFSPVILSLRGSTVKPFGGLLRKCPLRKFYLQLYKLIFGIDLFCLRGNWVWSLSATCKKKHCLYLGCILVFGFCYRVPVLILKYILNRLICALTIIVGDTS